MNSYGLVEYSELVAVFSQNTFNHRFMILQNGLALVKLLNTSVNILFYIFFCIYFFDVFFHRKLKLRNLLSLYFMHHTAKELLSRKQKVIPNVLNLRWIVRRKLFHRLFFQLLKKWIISLKFYYRIVIKFNYFSKNLNIFFLLSKIYP